MKGEENEKKTEAYLRERVKAIGGLAYKFSSPGRNGVPDRMVVLPGGHIVFCEIKSPAGRITVLQELELRRLREYGLKCFVLRSRAEVDQFILQVLRG